jgi:hypothetical protein
LIKINGAKVMNAFPHQQRPERGLRPRSSYYPSPQGLSSIGVITSPARVGRSDASSYLSPARTALARLILEVVMRMLVKAVFDTDAASEVIASGQGAK